MGSAFSANHTVLGKAVYKKTYVTKVPVAFGYSLTDKVYYMKDWEENNTYSSPYVGQYYVKLDPGVIFTIICVEKKWDFENGTQLNLHIQIRNNVPIYDNTVIQEAVLDRTKPKDLQKWGVWQNRLARQSNNKLFNKITNKERTIIMTKGMTGRIFGSQFFGKDIWESLDFNKVRPHNHTS